MWGKKKEIEKCQIKRANQFKKTYLCSRTKIVPRDSNETDSNVMIDVITLIGKFR
ncbi:hypothetical protein TorRG33x02_258240 [Trema orientale]|uniref:Uncharacterized protein n=1 Tax=Trema orientale TaxID=63057 RepID=A0A2P5D990_TREOI|nr:hypothetical protein TorRG33x02_258240 [Trema orientale]